MDKPVFKVLHIPDLDFRTQFSTLTDGLQQQTLVCGLHPNHYRLLYHRWKQKMLLQATDDQTNKLMNDRNLRSNFTG